MLPLYLIVQEKSLDSVTDYIICVHRIKMAKFTISELILEYYYFMSLDFRTSAYILTPRY